jgi:AraC-like DNA-binding protein
MMLYVKFMVSNRCKMAVEAELKKIGLHRFVIELGKVEMQEEITPEQLVRLNAGLLLSGLELMSDARAILVESIKNTIIKMVHYDTEQPKVKYSVFLSETLNHNYTYLSNLFSCETGNTIEHFIIVHKIERAKELLFYDELSLTQISYMLNYSSVAHLSNQFKKVTGLTPSSFKHLKTNNLNSLNDL